QYPYHFTPVQELLPTDHEKRTQFCEWYVQQIQEDDFFPSRILWTDEASLTRGDVFNFH
ncbi:hypothetical protein EAI_10755, partial [Harpegnathos saltator]